MSEPDGSPGGALLVVGTPIGNLGDLSPRAAEALARASIVACEDTRRTRALLSAAGIPAGGRLVALHAHNEAAGAERVAAAVARGATVALVSDAGMPALSDPGQRVVAAVAAAGGAVVVVPGPSAVTTALVASGLATDRFCFEGFLPRKGPERRARIEALAAERRTTVLFEAPSRLAATVAELAERLGGQRRLAICRELTKRFEEVWRGTLAEAERRLAGAPPRGELVVVVEGAGPPPPPGDEAVAEALRRALAAGCDRREAVTRVAADLDVPRRRAYAIATGL